MLIHWISWKVFNVLAKRNGYKSCLNEYTKIMSRRGQGHCLTFDQGLSYYDNFKHLFKATGPIVTKSHLEPPGADGTKICSNPIVHMTNMATTPIYGKIL